MLASIGQHGLPQFGGDGYAKINPARHLDDDDGRAPPIAILYHELSHANSAMSNQWEPGVPVRCGTIAHPIPDTAPTWSGQTRAACNSC